MRAGDDVQEGEKVLTKGTRLRPQEVGLLAAVGEESVTVVKPWSVTIIATGDELITPGDRMEPGKVRNINNYGLEAIARQMGFDINGCFLLKDERGLLEETVRSAMRQSDIVAVSGGSYKGKKDETASVIGTLASEGILTQGLALKPGKPTILGYDVPTGTILLGLPGHPSAAMIVFQLLIGWLWEDISGGKKSWPVPAELTVNVPAAPGRAVCQTVQLLRGEDGRTKAVPVFGRSGLISILTKADGYIVIPENQEGLKKGEMVEVFLI